MTMEIIDISWPITTGMTEYKNKGTVQCTSLKQFAQDKVRDSVVTIGVHTGTHVDAPSHFLEKGFAIDSIPLHALVGKCRVIDLTGVSDHISRVDLEPCGVQKGEIILFKTANSRRSPDETFDPSFMYLDADGARYVASIGIKAVGIDYLGIERNQPNHETHKTFMEKGIVIIEGLRLAHVAAGDYFLCCLPLAFVGLEAAPARAILLQSSPV